MSIHRLADDVVDLRGDNTRAAAPEIVPALPAANSGTAAGIGLEHRSLPHRRPPLPWAWRRCS